MLKILLTVVSGVLLGFLAGLGVGGGTLLILLLTFISGYDHETARAVNLMFFIASAGTVSIFRFKNGHLNIRKILPAVISGCIAAGLFAWIGTILDRNITNKIFGLLLLAIGIRELFYRPRNAK